MTADLNTRFCLAQNVFGNGTTVESTDWIDLKVAQDVGGGTDVCVEILVTTTFSGGTSAQFVLSAVDVDGLNPVNLDATLAIPVASLVAPTAGLNGITVGGTRLLLRVSAKNALPAATLKWLRLRTVNVGNNAAGAITAQLIHDTSTVFPGKAYAAGF